MFDYTISDIFSFEKRDVTRHMIYDMHLPRKVKDSFQYLAGKLGVKTFTDKTDLNKLKWSEGKNYDWLFIKHENVTFGIRQYQQHFTIFSKREKGNDDWRARFAVFTFETDLTGMTGKEHDSFYDNKFQDLNKHLKQLFEMAANDKLWGLWNDRMFERPARVKVKCAWSGGEDDIENIDLFNFACEEIFHKFLEVFSVNDMLERVKEIRVGQKLGEYEVTSVRKAVKDEYYHGVGIEWQNNREKKWNDVYALTRWHFSEMFPQGFMLKF